MSSHYRICFCFRRQFRPASNEPPEAIRELFGTYAGDGGHMGPEQLLRFMVDVQEEKNATLEMAQEMVDKFREFKLIRRNGLSLDAFFRYLFSDDNPPLTLGIHHDMTAPLSHYFIYTGHNSYLTGNQLTSGCSDVPIINALRRGVRVIELDMWPSSAGDEVYILHGRTLTSPVELIKCLTSIKEHAFYASPYPVIITLEDHLTPKLQTKVAEMIHQTFGEMLFTPEILDEFPSPEDLKYRIIISTKPPKEYLEEKPRKGKDSHVKAKHSADEGSWGSEVPDFKAEDVQDQGENFQDDEDFDDREQKPSQKAAPEYTRLIAITAKKLRGGFRESFKSDPEKVTRLSLSEQVLEKAAVRHGTEIVRFTQRNLLRIYPKGTRITSSNYNPLVGWMHGAQMVAFNMQGYGRSLWLMHGMFRANGGCGYIKKPDILLKNNEPDGRVFNPKVTLNVKKILKVRVYMGDGWRFDFSRTHFDAYSPPDFYTRVGIAGVPADTIMKRTRAIEDNWTPVWDEEFIFNLTAPELALLRVEVHEYDLSEKDDFAGQTCLPLSEVRSGIRAVPLFHQGGNKLNSVKILMRFKVIDI